MLAGLDYSMTCPAIHVNGHFYYLLSKESKKQPPNTVVALDDQKNVHGCIYYNFAENDVLRWHTISEWMISVMKSQNVVAVNMEDYSFNSKNGRSFHIAENSGLAKHKLWQHGITINLVSPTVVKKLATGKGNAQKEDMVAAYQKLFPSYDEWTHKSPWADCVDAYYMAQCTTFNRTLKMG